MNENETLTVTLTLDNDEELECAVLTIFETEGREYIALLPLNEDGNSDDGQVYLYRFINNGEDAEPDLENIEDDAEFDRVSEAFNEWMEEQDPVIHLQSGKELSLFRFLFSHSRLSVFLLPGSWPHKKAFFLLPSVHLFWLVYRGFFPRWHAG